MSFNNFLNIADTNTVPLNIVNIASRHPIESIKNLVQKIIKKQGNDLHYAYFNDEQKELDTLIYELYGLSKKQVYEIEIWYCRRYPKLAEAQGLMDKYS